MLTKRLTALQTVLPVPASGATGARVVLAQGEAVPATGSFFTVHQATELLTDWGCTVFVHPSEQQPETAPAR
jgi:hypothetical protein